MFETATIAPLLVASDQLSAEPGTRKMPLAVSTCSGNTEDLASLFNGQPSEIPELDQLNRCWIFAGQLGYRVIERKQFFG